MSDNIGEYFHHLSPSQQARFESIVSYVRNNMATGDPHILDYFLNALVATGPEDTADRIEAWAGKVCDGIEMRDRPAFCHSNSPHADRIVRVPSFLEITETALAKSPDT